MQRDPRIKVEIEIDTSELDRMISLAETRHTQEIGEFIEWCRIEKHLLLCGPVLGRDLEEAWEPTYITIEQLLAEYVGVDLSKVEAQRRELLAKMEAEHQALRAVREAQLDAGDPTDKP